MRNLTRPETVLTGVALERMTFSKFLTVVLHE